VGLQGTFPTDVIIVDNYYPILIPPKIFTRDYNLGQVVFTPHHYIEDGMWLGETNLDLPYIDVETDGNGDIDHPYSMVLTKKDYDDFVIFLNSEEFYKHALPVAIRRPIIDNSKNLLLIGYMTGDPIPLDLSVISQTIIRSRYASYKKGIIVLPFLDLGADLQVGQKYLNEDEANKYLRGYTDLFTYLDICWVDPRTFLEELRLQLNPYQDSNYDGHEKKKTSNIDKQTISYPILSNYDPNLPSFRPTYDEALRNKESKAPDKSAKQTGSYPILSNYDLTKLSFRSPEVSDKNSKQQQTTSYGISNNTSHSQNTRVFISFGREDLEYAERLHNDLKKVGLSPWRDRGRYRPGEK
jgi:hypothetical protein